MGRHTKQCPASQAIIHTGHWTTWISATNLLVVMESLLFWPSTAAWLAYQQLWLTSSAVKGNQVKYNFFGHMFWSFLYFKRCFRGSSQRALVCHTNLSYLKEKRCWSLVASGRYQAEPSVSTAIKRKRSTAVTSKHKQLMKRTSVLNLWLTKPVLAISGQSEKRTTW